MQTLTREKEIYEEPAFKAMIARAAYEENWTLAGRSGRGDLPGTEWKYQASLSDDRRAVWYNKTMKYVVIAYRGTDFGNAAGGRNQDLATDVTIAFNKTSLTPMYREDTRHFNRVKAAFPDASIEVTGHSLGGHRAKTIGRNFEVPSFGVNEGATPLMNVTTIGDRVYCKLFPKSKRCQHTSVRVEYDPISVASVLHNKTETIPYPKDRDYTLLDPHTDAMGHVLPLDAALMVCNDDGSFCI